MRPSTSQDPLAESVLTFVARRAGSDGLGYDDLIVGLSTELAGLSLPRVAAVLKRLSKDGYVESIFVGKDRQIWLTPTGVALMSTLVPRP